MRFSLIVLANKSDLKKRKKFVLEQVKIILVEPSHPGNIGGAARAMKTMGIERLTIVNPRRFPDPQADWRAAGATDVLDASEVVTTLDEAISDCRYLVGTSARARSIPWPVIRSRELGENLSIQPAGSQIGILFGREDSGLTNDELHKCQCHLQIPSSSTYGSLNLAMAVQVVCYEIFQHCRSKDQGIATTGEVKQTELAGLGTRIWDKDPASVGQVEDMLVHLQQVLEQSGFLQNSTSGNTVNRLRRMLLRAQLDETEVQILRGMLKQFGAQ